MDDLSRFPTSPLADIAGHLFDLSYLNLAGGPLTPPVDVQATPNEFILHADVHGLKPKEVHVEVEGAAVTIWGEARCLAANGQAHYLLQERPVGHFRRTITLPAPVDASQAEAVFENGLLTLRLPIAEAARVKSITIRAKSPRAPRGWSLRLNRGAAPH